MDCKLATRILDRSNVATLLSANDGRSNNEVSVTQPSAWVQILTTEKKSAWLCTGEEGTDFLVKTLLVYLGPGQMLWTWLPGLPKILSCWLWGCLGGKVWTTSLIPRFSMNQWLIIPWGIFKSLAICFFPLENVEKLYIFQKLSSNSEFMRGCFWLDIMAQAGAVYRFASSVDLHFCSGQLLHQFDLNVLLLRL